MNLNLNSANRLYTQQLYPDMNNDDKLTIFGEDHYSNRSLPLYMVPKHIANESDKIFLPNQWNHKCFQFGRPLGRGKFGHVYLARQKKSKFVVAIKIVTKKQAINGGVVSQIRREIQIQTHLNHPNILKMYGFFQDQKRIYFVLEYAAGGEMYKDLKKCGKYSELVASKYIKQVVQAFIHLHQNNVIHRDIKPQNILLCHNGVLKISDFGWSTHALTNKRSTMCGTLDYLCPEILDKKAHDATVDLWGIGILTYELVCGCPPFQSNYTHQTHRKIRKVELNFPGFLSEEIKDFIGRLLVKESQVRMKLTEALKHPWIRMYNN